MKRICITKKQLAEICAFYKTKTLRPYSEDIKEAHQFLSREWKAIEYIILGRLSTPKKGGKG